MNNMVNAKTTRVAGGKSNPYRRKIFSIDTDGNASIVDDEKTPLRIMYFPDHPHADENGCVSYPNVNLINEIVELLCAMREYSLAESLLKRCLPDNYVSDYSIHMAMQTADYFREIGENRNRLDRIEQKLDALIPAR